MKTILRNIFVPQLFFMNKKGFIYAVIVVLLIVVGIYINNHKTTNSYKPMVGNQIVLGGQRAVPNDDEASPDVRQLSSEQVVVPYLKAHHHLPNYYITKEEAREQGWTPSQGNLCDVLPGTVIGGDHFYNKDGQLPEKPGRKWFEADLNYDCATRNADRLLYSNDGLIFVTYDHYQTFQEK